MLSGGIFNVNDLLATSNLPRRQVTPSSLSERIGACRDAVNLSCRWGFGPPSDHLVIYMYV